MTAQETKLLNAFETTISGAMSSTALTITVNAVSNAAGDTLTAPCYLVIEPDSATQREYFLVSSIDTGTKTLTISAIGNRYLAGSAATSGLTHAAGSTIRMSAMAQHFEDLNDRVDANFNEAGTQIVAGNAVKDEDNMASDSAVHLATQQSIKAYVDSQVTAQDLDFAGDGGSSYRYLKGSAATSGLSHASGSTIRYVAMAQHFEDLNDRIDANFNEAGTEIVAGNAVKDEDTMSSDSAVHLATQQSIKAYVDSQVTAQDLDFAGDSGTGQVDLDSQTFTIAGTVNEIETSALDQTITIGLPSSITVDVVGNLTGNVTGNVTGNLTGNVTGDLTGDVTGNVTGNLTGNVTGNVTGDLTGNVTATSVLADGVTATTQTAGDNSTKVATTAYVDSISVDDYLTFAGDTGSGTVDLDTQTFTVAGTTNEIETSATGQTLT